MMLLRIKFAAFLFLNFDKYTLLCNQNPIDVHSFAISSEIFLKPLLNFTHHECNPCSCVHVGVCENVFVCV